MFSESSKFICAALLFVAACVPTANDAACQGGLSFTPCSLPDALFNDDAMVAQLCGANIGFESTPSGIEVALRDMSPNAFSDISVSADKAYCGSKSLRIGASFTPRSSASKSVGEVDLLVPSDAVPSAGELALWLQADAPTAVPLSAVVEVFPFSAVGPQATVVSLVPGQWTRFVVGFDYGSVSPAAVQYLRVSIHVISIASNWSGAVYVDEVSWSQTRRP